MTGAHMPPNPNDGLTFNADKLRTLYLAGGCFWGTDAYMRRVPGVAYTLSGYAQGHVAGPSYEAVCTGTTGHAEAVRVDYDPERLPLRKLLLRFFDIIDPTVKNRQGHDSGSQYRTGVYYTDPADLPDIESVFTEVAARYDAPIVTERESFTCFYPAEDYHQDYLEKNPGGYCHVDLSGLYQGEL